jgi:N,N'-diacetylchitobiose transport system permease protein
MSVDTSKAVVTTAVEPGGAESRSRPRRRHGGLGWAPVILFGPAGIVLAGVLGYPLVRLIINSFQDFGLRALFTGTTQWIGFANYLAIFKDSQFGPVLLRTGVFTLSLVIGCLIIGMAMAQMMTHLGKGIRTVLNFLLILAWALPTVSSTLVWQWLFQPVYGVINWLITQVGWFGDYTSHRWTGTPSGAFLIVWLLIVWQSVPFVALTLYAGQSQIPAEFYEAAQLDGASTWRMYRSVTLPFLRPVLYLATILQIIWHFNTFNQLWILTQGGPDHGTTTLSIWAFQKAFASNSFGQGSAIAVVTAILLMIITSVYIRRLIRSGEMQ